MDLAGGEALCGPAKSHCAGMVLPIILTKPRSSIKERMHGIDTGIQM
jgi:hypothetical protein